MIAWEPSFAWKLKFRFKITNFSSHVKNIPMVLPGSPIKIWGKLVKGFMSYDRTYKQSNRDYYFVNKDCKLGNPALTRVLRITPAGFPHTWSLITILAIFSDKCRLTRLRMNIPMVPPSSTIGQWVPKLWSDKQTDRQTNRDYNLINLYMDCLKKIYYIEKFLNGIVNL